MAKIRTYTFEWDASLDADVMGYNVYWAYPPDTVGDGLNPADYDNPNQANVGNVTSVSLPLGSMPTDYDGDINIGVAAVDDVGNISDISSITAPFDLMAPVAPTNLRIT